MQGGAEFIPDPTFGSEFEHVSEQTAKAWENPKNFVRVPDRVGFWAGREKTDAKRLMWAVKKRCKTLGCRVESTTYKHGDEFLVIFEDGLWVRLSYDPMVTEVQMKPQKLNELIANKKRLQSVIFGAARDAGLKVDKISGAGQFNIGFFSMFGRDHLTLHRFASFFFDLENNAELWLGALGTKLFSAKPMSVQKASQRRQYAGVAQNLSSSTFSGKRFTPLVLHTVLEYYLRYLSGAQHNPSLQNPFKQMDSAHNQMFNIQEVYNFLYKKNHPSADVKVHMNHDIVEKGLEIPLDDVPFELRSLRAQSSMDEFILLAELFMMRWHYLKELNFPTFYFSRSLHNPTDTEVVSRFYAFVVDMGGDYEKFKKLLPLKLRRMEPDPFISLQKSTIDNEAEFLILKKHIPMLPTSVSVQVAISSVIDQWMESKGLNPWVPALIKEMYNEAHRHLKHQPELARVFIELINHKMGESENRYKLIANMIRSPKRIEKFLKRAKEIEDTINAYQQELNAMICKEYFR